MAIQIINTGSTANAGNGDSLRTAFNKVNANFAYLGSSSRSGERGFIGYTGSQGIIGFTGSAAVANTGNFTFNEDTITNDNGLILDTNRGKLSIGADMEVPGVAQHFHIAFDESNINPPSSDLFLGDDHNYVKLPGSELNDDDYGVEIGTHDRDGGDSHTWRFGTDGKLTLPAGGDILNSNGQSVLSGVPGLVGDTEYEPIQEGDLAYALKIADDAVRLKVYDAGNTPNNLGPGISLGNEISDKHRAGVVAIGNDDVGYNSKQGGVYIGAKAGWNNVEGPQGEFAIAIGAKAAYIFAYDRTITLNATGQNLNPLQADSLYIKPIREVVENTAKAVYYNTTTGEVTYADPTGGGSYTPDDAGLWNDPTINTVAAALDELAVKIAALQNFEIDGGNANTPAVGELIIDGYGA